MRRNLFALAALLAMLATAFEAHAVCTAGNGNANVIESTPTSALTDNGDGTVTHNLTGLMWKQCAEGLSGAGCATGSATTFTWANALIQAKNANFASQTDWRLPNKKELESIVESCGYNPSINQTRFPATPASFFWSSSSYVPFPAGAWIVYFNFGNTYASNKAGSYDARLVRGGQSFDAFDAQKANQTISFGAAPTVVAGGTGTVSATGGASLNPVTFSSTTPGVCTVVGSTVTGVTVGTCTIAADQAGDGGYNAAPQMTQSFAVSAPVAAGIPTLSEWAQIGMVALLLGGGLLAIRRRSLGGPRSVVAGRWPDIRT